MIAKVPVSDLHLFLDIRDDVQEEAEKFDTVLDIKIPRPAGARTSPGVGKIYVKFASVEGAQKALAALAGRKFADRTVVVSFFSEVYLNRFPIRGVLNTNVSNRSTLMSMPGKESW